MTTPEQTAQDQIDRLVDRKDVIEFEDQSGNDARMIDPQGIKTLLEVNQKIEAATARRTGGIHRIIRE